MIDQLENKTIVVTGGSGFIGSNFIQLLFSKLSNINIINIDKLGHGSRNWYPKSNTLDVNAKYRLYNVDLSEPHGDILKQILNNVDYVFHFAAESHVDRSIRNPSTFIVNNIGATGNLLNAIIQSNSNPKVVCISTDEVYGHLGIDDDPFTTTTRLLPRSPYAASKASSDLVALSFVETFGMDISITRCCNNFGPHQDEEKFIPTVIRSLCNKTKIPVYGNGQNIREWIHVDEHNHRVIEMAINGTPGEIRNIGTGKEKTNLELIDDILRDCYNYGAIPNRNRNEYVEFVDDRKGHDFRYAINCNEYKWNYHCSPFERDDLFTQTVIHFVNKHLEYTERPPHAGVSGHYEHIANMELSFTGVGGK